MSVAPYPEVEQVAINLKLGQTPCIINSTENFILWHATKNAHINNSLKV